MLKQNQKDDRIICRQGPPFFGEERDSVTQYIGNVRKNQPKIIGEKIAERINPKIAFK